MTTFINNKTSLHRSTFQIHLAFIIIFTAAERWKQTKEDNNDSYQHPSYHITSVHSSIDKKQITIYLQTNNNLFSLILSLDIPMHTLIDIYLIHNLSIYRLVPLHSWSTSNYLLTNLTN